MRNESFSKRLKIVNLNSSVENLKKITSIDKDEKLKDRNNLKKKEIPISNGNTLITNSNVKKKNSYSISSSNDIFLKSNTNFQKNKSNQESKSTINSNPQKIKNIQTIEFFTPKEITDKFVKYLNVFEQEEIFLFQEIYYCGKFLKNKQQMMKIESNSHLGSSLVRNNTSTHEDEKGINFK